MNKDLVEKKVTQLKSDIELLKNGHIHELEKKPGILKCVTLANRMEENLREIVEAYEADIEEQAYKEDRTQFDLLYGLLKRLSDEIAILSKKQPDGLVNGFKVGQINRVLVPLKELMKDEPTIYFLDILSIPEPDPSSNKSRNSYSDTALILSQYREACAEYSAKYYRDWDLSL